MTKFREDLPIITHDGKSWSLDDDLEVIAKRANGAIVGPYRARILEFNRWLAHNPITHYQVLPREKTEEELREEFRQEIVDQINELDHWSTAIDFRRALLSIMEFVR